jgi:hypothetical protein
MTDHKTSDYLRPWRAGQLAKAIRVLQAREIEGRKRLSEMVWFSTSCVSGSVGVLLDPRRVLACFQRSSTTKDPSFDTTSTTAQLVRAKSQHR